MPNEVAKTRQCVDDLRHAEYYGMQEIYDDLYARSKNGEVFTDLMSTILSRENILLAYRNIKTNTGSKTAGTDGLTIHDIGKLQPEEVVDKVRYIVSGKKNGYIPKPVRRKDIPKASDPTKTRPLGIPCIWDRLVQQCIKQVLEPICEAKFSDNSFGFRPQRSTEHAIARVYQMLQLNDLHYVVEFDIKGFFDNVSHTKLIRQMWTLGIRDTHLISKIKRMLKAPIRMPDGSTIYPDKGTPQGGIISPLLANIVLNELDHWVESQWQLNPLANKNSYLDPKRPGHVSRQYGYRVMRETQLKEMYIVRYADDFRIFCRTKNDAEKVKIAVTQWLLERLKLEVSPEKTRVVNVRKKYSEFLGFKIMVRSKAGKKVVKSHMSDKQLQRSKRELVEQAKRIARPRKGETEYDELRTYNAMVVGKHNYYRIATEISQDSQILYHATTVVLYNRLQHRVGNRLSKHGRPLTTAEKRMYGRSEALRYLTGQGEPIYPAGYVQHKKPMNRKRTINCYTAEGRAEIHDSLGVNVGLMLKLMKQPSYGRSAEYMDNRVSLFSAQHGKCAVTGREFLSTEDIHCHHITPKKCGGGDGYGNLILVLEPVHRLIHATDPEVINNYLQMLRLNKSQMAKLNKLRQKAGVAAI